MHKEYKSYDILNNLSNRVLDNLEHDSSLGVFDAPFFIEEGHGGEKLLNFKDIVFINTKLLSPSAEYFRKHKVYTKLHPDFDRKEYEEFWDEEERRRKDGFDAPCRLVKDKTGAYVTQSLHITGEHYGYLNYAPIMRVNDWALAEVGKLLKAGVDPKDRRIQKLVDKKEEDMPLFLDADYYYFKAVEYARANGEHLVVAKARRKGYSYKNGWLAADKADLYRNSVTGLGAFHADSLYPKGTMGMANNYLQHVAAHTDWTKRRLIDKQDHVKFGYKLNDALGIERGYKSSIFAASFAPNNPGALRGKDCLFMMLEESGKNPILAQILSSTLPTLKAGVFTTGLMIVFGTGGGDDKHWEDFEDLFYFPSVQGFLCFNNIWDEDSKGTECGFFVSSYMGKEGFFDKHGNSDVKGAILFEEREREKKRKSRKATALTDYMMEEPFTPKEAFSRSKSNIFPSAELEQQLKRVQKNPDIQAMIRSGNLLRNSEGKVIFKDKLFMDEKELKYYHPPILNFPLKKEDDAFGCVVIYSPPYRDKSTGLVPSNLYRVCHDPYALPKDTEKITSRDSLGATYIYERVNNLTHGLGDRLVAEFVGRPPTTGQYNDIMFMLAEYYNAIIQFENDRGDVFNYAKTKRKLNMLADEPDIISKKALQTKKVGRKKGITINGPRKEAGVIYIRDWLLEPRGKGTEEENLENRNKALNLHYIYSEALLKELLKYNLKGNFDRVSSLIVNRYDAKETFFNDVRPQQPIMNRESVFNRDLF